MSNLYAVRPVRKKAVRQFKPPTSRSFINPIPLADFLSSELVFFDLETSGFEVGTEDIVQLAAKSAEKELNHFVNPRIHGIEVPKFTPSGYTLLQGKVFKRGMVEVESDDLSIVLEGFVSFCESFDRKVTLVAHNASFDVRFLRHALEETSLFDRFSATCFGFLDTLPAARHLWPKAADGPADHTIRGILRHFFGEVQADLHDAQVDTLALHDIFHCLGDKEDFQPFTYVLPEFVQFQDAVSIAKDVDGVLTHRLNPEQLMQLAGKFDLAQLQALAQKSQEEFVEEVACSCPLLSSHAISTMFEDFKPETTEI